MKSKLCTIVLPKESGDFDIENNTSSDPKYLMNLCLTKKILFRENEENDVLVKEICESGDVVILCYQEYTVIYLPNEITLFQYQTLIENKSYLNKNSIFGEYLIGNRFELMDRSNERYSDMVFFDKLKELYNCERKGSQKRLDYYENNIKNCFS